MDIKQAAFYKLATIRMAINHVLRTRWMSKNAAGYTVQDIAKGSLLGAGPRRMYDWWNRQDPRFRGAVMGGMLGPAAAPRAPQGAQTPTLPNKPAGR